MSEDAQVPKTPPFLVDVDRPVGRRAGGHGSQRYAGNDAVPDHGHAGVGAAADG